MITDNCVILSKLVKESVPLFCEFRGVEIVSVEENEGKVGHLYFIIFYFTLFLFN